MPTRVPARKADRRVSLYTRRIHAADTDKSRTNAVIGWLLGEYNKIGPDRRPYWLKRWIDLAREMNEEARR